jgi:hypothetical protein
MPPTSWVVLVVRAWREGGGDLRLRVLVGDGPGHEAVMLRTPEDLVALLHDRLAALPVDHPVSGGDDATQTPPGRSGDADADGGGTNAQRPGA